MRRVFGIIISSIAFLVMSIGVWTLYDTEIRLINSVPTTAVITDKFVEQVKDVNGQFYAQARYRYNVNGDLYIGDKIFVIDFTTPMQDYLLSLIDPLPIDVTTVAFYNKNNPRDSFLKKSIPYPPYVGILASLLLFTAGIYLVMTPGFGNRLPKKLANGWYEMVSEKSHLIEMEQASLIQAVVFGVISIFTFAHYFLHAPKSNGVLEIAVVCGFILIGARFFKQTRDLRKQVLVLGDLHLELEFISLEMDKEYKARIRQKFRRDTQIVSCDIGVIGHKSNIHGPIEYEVWYQNAINKKFDPKSEFKLDQTFSVSSHSLGDVFCLAIRVQSAEGKQEWSFPVSVNRPNLPISIL